MKTLHTNLKKGEIKLEPENMDDLWYLSHIISLNDLIRSKTLRKIKLGGEDERSAKIIKKPITITISIEKVEFAKYSDVLRLSGPIAEGTEDVSKGSYHTISIEPHSPLTIIKDQWQKYQLDKIKEATESKPSKVLICVFDREEAMVALLKTYGFDVIAEIKGSVQKKADMEKTSGNFYLDLIRQLKDYHVRYKLEQIVIASPAFFKEDLLKQLTDGALKKMIVTATCNHVGKQGIIEVLKRPELKEALKQERVAKELKSVEEIFSEISKDGTVAYGIKEVTKAGEAGAISRLLVTDTLISKSREDGSFEALDNLIKLTDSLKAKIQILSSDEATSKLDGLGGIAALLRYKMR